MAKMPTSNASHQRPTGRSQRSYILLPDNREEVAAADMQITSSNFTGNSAKDGSAIAWLGEGGTITGSYFADNDDAPLTFNINNLASDLNIEANTFAISNLSIKTDKIEYDYGATGNVSGIFNWGVNDYPIDLVISWTKDGIGMEDIVIENFIFDGCALVVTKTIVE